MHSTVRRCGAPRSKTRGRPPRSAGTGCRALGAWRGSRVAWTSADCIGVSKWHAFTTGWGGNRRAVRPLQAFARRGRKKHRGSVRFYELDAAAGAAAADAGFAALDADFGSGTFLPVRVSGGGIDRRMSLSFFGGCGGSSPLQPANNASGDNAQCNWMPPGRRTVFCTVVFSITLSTARPTVFWPRLSLSGTQSSLNRVGAYGSGDLPLEICEPLIPGVW